MSKKEGPKSYYRGDKKIDITWGDKISKSLKNKKMLRTHICPNCMDSFQSYLGSKVFCSSKCKTGFMKESDVIGWKTRSLGANILSGATTGEKKSEFLYNMIKNSIGKPCPYCNELITINNCSLDHKEPIGKNWIRREKRKEESKQIRLKLDNKDNLQIICRRCNGIKGDLSDNDFSSLVLFLEDKPKLKESIFNRISMSRTVFGHRTHKK